MTDKFEPWLGRIGDRGRVDERLYRQKARKAEAFLGRVRAKTRFTGVGLGRGGASARALEIRGQRMPAYRMRRVIVKTHISRAPKGGGTGALRAHLGYIQRDGVERGGSGGELYGREGSPPDADGFAARCEDDRHQFRIIVSPEDAGRLGDLKETTRALMALMESDLGTRLDWLAVDHHNTGHPHTHIVIRGKDAGGRDLVIAPAYIREGLAARAQDIVTERLGPRRDLEIAEASQSEVTKERFTGLDRAILAGAEDGIARVTEGSGPGGRFDAALRRARLRHLEGLKLAAPAGRDAWQLKPGWEASLTAMGHRGDILRALAARGQDDVADHNLRRFEPGAHGYERLAGTVITSLPEDELRDRRSLIVEDFQNGRWMVDIGMREPGTIRPDGARRHLDDWYRARAGEVISGWMKRKHSAVTRGAPEDVLQTRITLRIDFGTAAIRPKTDRFRICVSGNSSPETVIDRLWLKDGCRVILYLDAFPVGAQVKWNNLNKTLL